MNIIESVSRLNPPLCAITGCRYLSRPLKRRSQRIGKIRLWLNRIKRGKFTFGNSKSERVEGSSRVAPATLLCTCLHLPPLSLSLYIFHSLSAPLPWDRVSLCSASFCTVSFRSNGVQCGRRSLRDCLHTDRRVFRASRFVSKPVHRLWNEEGGKEGWRKCISRAPVRYFCRVTLFRSWEKHRSISPSGTCFRMVKFSYTFENHRDN